MRRPRLLTWVLAAVLAAVSCEGDDMGVPQKPNWGRSFPMSQTQGPEVELVRVQLPRSEDFTLYLNEGSNTLGYINLNEFHVSVGNGGTSRNLTIQASVLGTTLHVVGSQVIVRATNYTPYPIPANEMPLYRVSAMAGLGRPYALTRRLFNNSNSNNLIPAASSRDFTLDPWVTAVQVSIEPTPLPSTVVSVSITEVSRMPSGDTPLIVAQPLSNYAAPKTLHPFTNVLTVENLGADAVYADIAEVQVL